MHSDFFFAIFILLLGFILIYSADYEVCRYCEQYNKAGEKYPQCSEGASLHY